VRGRKLQWNGVHGRWTLVIKNGVSDRLDDVDIGVDDDEEAGEEGEEEGDDEDAAERVEKQARDTADAADDVEEEEEGDAVDGNEGEAELPLPKLSSPQLNCLYGQYMLNGKAYQSSLCELFHPKHAIR
jgi:hypothetical protein